MPSNSKPLDIRQDLQLRGPADKLEALRTSLAERAVRPWRYNALETDQFLVLGEDELALAFERSATPGFEAAGLLLTATKDGMEVASIVPLLTEELSVVEHNRILCDFAACIAQPVAQALGYRVELSSSTLQFEDLLPQEVMAALQRFSDLADKANGAAHPLDKDRWFDFVILSYCTGVQLEGSILERWLYECESWPRDIARNLAAEYERSCALLAHLRRKDA